MKHRSSFSRGPHQGRRHGGAAGGHRRGSSYARPRAGHSYSRSVHQRPPAPRLVREPTGPPTPAAGTLELTDRQDGFLRDPRRNYAVHPDDPWVSADMIRRFNLRGGEQIHGIARGNGHVDPAFALTEIERIMGAEPAATADFKPFEDLTVVDPREPIRFETEGGPLTMRVVDLLTPIGRGQRGLIVAPPRTGKTVLLGQMAAAIRANYPEIRLMMLLIDERPEEVTEIRRSLGAAVPDPPPDAPEVVYSSNDKDVVSHVRIARLMLAKAKRRVERGEHVFILLDSLTRLGRAFNAFVGSSGRTMSGGIDIRALIEPKSIFGAARTIEHGGSLTIIASALIDTGSRGDEFIFQEFKGTGNMELVLSRELANLRIWPAMDVAQSGTRKEELLLQADSVHKVYRLRRRLMAMPQPARIQSLVAELGNFKSNREFLAAMRD